MTSPAQRHMMRVSAAMTAQREAAPLRHATVYEQMLVKLAADQRTLKAIYSKELKAAKKRELLPFWLPWVNGVLEQGKGAQDDILMTGLIESLSPSGRRRLSAELAKRLRQSQQRRVMAQKAPDGTPYAPRQQQSARKKTGRVKRKMFAKLITSRFLHIRASPEQASMEFYGGKSPKIASVHQFGLSEENRKDGKKIDYPARPLLGFTGEDVQMIEEIILAHLDR